MELNKQDSLHIGEEKNFYGNQPNSQLATFNLQLPLFSYFMHPISNTTPSNTISITQVYHVIKDHSFRHKTRELRTITDKAKARKYKANNFSYVTFSGIFSQRNDKALIEHSGLLTIDFDHISNIESLKKRLLNDDYFDTELLFISPSGDGIKWIITIDLSKASHSDYFQAVANYIKHTYQIDIDKSGKDVSRACFIPHDEAVYINPKYLL